MERLHTVNVQAEALDEGWAGLRSDIELHPPHVHGAADASWVIEDPVSGRYFSIGETEAILVEALQDGEPPSLAVARVRRAGLQVPPRAEVRAFLEQLHQAGLCRAGSDRTHPECTSGPGFWTRLMHGYVYYRIPLLRPDAGLTGLAPWVRPLASRSFRSLLHSLGLLGLLLTIPQAELYFATASYLLTPGGVVSFFACLVALKVGHELAHAFSAKLMGLHVRSIGVAFILLWPILYTDVTDAWRQRDRRLRARIGSAGIRFELAIAGMSLLLWSVLPDGVLRSLAFYLSSASILSTVLINLNPFARFDGYYLLVDAWGIDNLQPRAFALLRYRMRVLSLGWRGRAPEQHPQAGLMCAYAGATVVYRVFIAIAIATAVFRFVGAIPGLLVGVLELYILLLRPVLRELREVVRNRAEIGSYRRTFASLAVASLLLLACVVPLDRHVLVPGVLTHERLQYVNAPFAGRIVQTPPPAGQALNTGDVLLVLASFEHDHEHAQLEKALQRNRAEQQALDTRGSEGGYRRWLEEDERRLEAAKTAVASRLSQLVVTASARGELVERDGDYEAGDWVPADHVLATVRQSSRLRIHAYVDDYMGARLNLDEVRSARLLPWDTSLASVEVPIVDAQLNPADRLPSLALFDRFGGPVLAVSPSRSEPVGFGRTGAQSPPSLRARDAYLALSFTAELPGVAARIPDASPTWVELQLRPVSLLSEFIEFLARTLSR